MSEQPPKSICSFCGSEAHPTGACPQRIEEKPEAKEAREAKEKEQEFLSAFFELLKTWQTLAGWTKGNLAYLKSEVTGYWKEEEIKPTQEQKQRLAKIEQTYHQVFDELDVLAKRFFDSPYTQSIFKRHLGQEIHSLEEADIFRQKLLEPFYETFQESKPEMKKADRRRAAAEFEEKEELALKQAINSPQWSAILEKLKFLPGDHQTTLSLYLKFHQTKDIRSLLNYGQPPKEIAEEYERFVKLEIPLTEADLLELEAKIKQAKPVLERVKVSWLPFLEKAEESILTVKEKTKRKAEEKARQEEARKRAEAREKSKIKIRLLSDKEIYYYPEALGEIQPGARFIKKGDQTNKPWIFQGVTNDGEAVLEAPDGIAGPIKSAKLSELFEPAEVPGEALAHEMRERFGEGFLGLEEAERAFTLKNGAKLIEFTPADREKAFRLLEKKLQEPDIQEFLHRMSKKDLQRDWLFILRVPQFEDKTSLTMKSLEERLAPDMLDQEQGKLLYNVDWYKNESFYTAESIKDMHWQLTSRAVLPGTKSKNHEQQSTLLQEQAQALRLDPAKIRRRTPVEILYDLSIIFRATGKRILKDEYDWTDTRASVGVFVSVGRCDARGAGVSGWRPEHADENLGASLSR